MKLIYYKIAIFWGFLNLIITLVGWGFGYNMFLLSLFFFGGFFLIFLVGIVDGLKEEKVLGGEK